MMGRSHAVSGLAAGFAVGQLTGITAPGAIVPFVLVTAGFAVLPDIDHPGSTVTRALGPVTGALSAGLRTCSAALYAVTKGPRDEDCDGTHRHLTHTLLFALVTGGAVGLLGMVSPWFVAVAMLAGIGLLNLALGTWSRKAARVAAALTRRRATKKTTRRVVANWPVAAGLATLLAWGGQHDFDAAAMHAELATLTWRIGVAVAVGCLVHCLGDAVTLSGCPFLFPLPIAGETWYELRPPRWMRFRTGGRIETGVVVALLAATALMAWPYLEPLTTGNSTQQQ